MDLPEVIWMLTLGTTYTAPLKQEATGLVAKKRDYYNLVRLCPRDVEDNDDTITAPLRAPEDRAFRSRLRIEMTSF
jgi:hypothetical protein